MGKLLRLRQGVLLAGTDGKRQLELLAASLSTMMVLFRAVCACTARGRQRQRRARATRAATLAGFDAAPFARAVRPPPGRRSRSGGRATDRGLPRLLGAQYLAGYRQLKPILATPPHPRSGISNDTSLARTPASARRSPAAATTRSRRTTSSNAAQGQIEVQLQRRADLDPESRRDGEGIREAGARRVRRGGARARRRAWRRPEQGSRADGQRQRDDDRRARPAARGVRGVSAAQERPGIPQAAGRAAARRTGSPSRARTTTARCSSTTRTSANSPRCSRRR